MRLFSGFEKNFQKNLDFRRKNRIFGAWLRESKDSWGVVLKALTRPAWRVRQ
jgi:hypothetical protein